MKKRSSTKINKPPKPTFFVDRNLGRKLVTLLRDAGFNVEAHDDHFPQRTPDTIWIPEVCERDWVIITRDGNLSRNSAEIDALMTSGGRVFLPYGRMMPADFGPLLARSEDKILRYLNRNRKSRSGPFLTKLRPHPKRPEGPGQLDIWVNEKIWMEKVKQRTR